MNPAKKKGTAGETELLRLLALCDIETRRTTPGKKWDLEAEGKVSVPPIELLAIRPDRGEWLVTMRLRDFVNLYGTDKYEPLRIEVKRYARSALHTIFFNKFGAR